MDSRGSLAWALAVALAGVVVLSGTAGASAPVRYGKVVGPGVFGVPYASSASPTFPSTPPLDSGALKDGDMVYDSAVYVEIVNAGAAPISLPVQIEEWTWGNTTVYENRTVNGNSTLVAVTVPVRDNPYWANATVTALPGTSGEASVSLPFVSAVTPLEVRVGSAVWELRALTPAGSSLAGLYTSGGLMGFGLTEAAMTTVTILVAIGIARWLAGIVHRVPKVPIIWPIAWIGVPVALGVLDYVPVNQTFGGASPLLIPIPIAVALLPYLPRLWGDFQWGRFNGIKAVSSKDATSDEATIPIVKTKSGLRRAPETWREVLWILGGVPLPEVKGETVDVLGNRVQVQPQGLAVSCPLPAWYKSDADAVFWFDTRAPLRNTRHKFVWTRTEETEKPEKGPDGEIVYRKISKRRFSPHVERGALVGRYPPYEPVASAISRVRSVEGLAHEYEAGQIALAEQRGEMWSRIRESGTRKMLAMEDRYRRREEARSDDELRFIVARGLPGRKGLAPGRPAPEPQEGDGA